MVAERRDEFIRLIHETNRARTAGILRDPPTKVFKARDAADAFQLLAQARHIGKVALEFDLQGATVTERSEERRVGKEGRATTSRAREQSKVALQVNG